MLRVSLASLACVWIVAAFPPARQLHDATALLQTSTGLSDVGSAMESNEVEATKYYERASALARELTVSQPALEKLTKITSGESKRENMGAYNDETWSSNILKPSVPANEIQGMQRALRATMQNLTFPPHAATGFQGLPHLNLAQEELDYIREFFEVANAQLKRNTGLHEDIVSLVPRMAALIGDHEITESLESTMARASTGFITPAIFTRCIGGRNSESSEP